MNKVIAAFLILCLLIVLCPAPVAVGQDADSAALNAEDKGAGYLPYTEPTALGSGGFFGAVIRTIFSLTIVLGMLYVTLWLIRKFSAGGTGPVAEGSVRLVGRIHLSPKIVVYFLRLADELLVIGTNAGNISPLATIKDEQTISKIENDLKSGQGGASGAAFSRLFDGSMAMFQKSPEGKDSTIDDQLSSLNDQIGRLKGLVRRRRGDE